MFKETDRNNYLSKEMIDSLIYDAEEICRIIGKIQVSSKAK